MLIRKIDRIFFDLFFCPVFDLMGKHMRANRNTPGIACRHFFRNGWGVSIVRHAGSYGGRSGLFEVAVLDSRGKICYRTDITSDVLGHLTWAEVCDLCYDVRNLNREGRLCF